MEHIRKVTKGLTEARYAEILEGLWFEIEDERSRCNRDESEY